MVFETTDNQLDFNKFILTDFMDNEKVTHKYEQYRMVLPREGILNDPIVKNKYMFSKGFNYTLSLRQSGNFDIYWNMSRKDSVNYGKIPMN